MLDSTYINVSLNSITHMSAISFSRSKDLIEKQSFVDHLELFCRPK